MGTSIKQFKSKNKKNTTTVLHLPHNHYTTTTKHQGHT